MNTSNRMNTVGFVGLGTMGAPMAANIMEAGHRLVAYDIDAGALERMVAQGAEPATGPADVARRAGLLVSMVTTTAQAEQVIAGPGGFIETARPGDLVLSMGTIDPTVYPALRDRLAAKGIGLVDAPVTGMDKGARERTLKAFVGGSAAAFAQARPVLDATCAEAFHMGDVGQGTAMKLINSLVFQISRVVAIEGLAIAAKAGLDPAQVAEIIGRTPSNSGAFQYAAQHILARDFQGVNMEITCKDVGLQADFARALQVPGFMVNAGQLVYEMAQAAGYGKEDPTAVVKVYEHFTGVPVRGRT